MLVARPHLKPDVVGRGLHDMYLVAVSHPCRIEPLAIVVDNHRAIDNLVLAIEIDVADAEVVETLARISLAFPVRRFRIEEPAFAQVVSIPVPCSEA